MRLDHQLGHGYSRFLKCSRRNQLEHSCTLFKHSTISMSSLTCWPEFKGKARNSAVVSLWLADELRQAAENDELPEGMTALASTLWGFAAMYCVYTSSGQQLTEIEARTLSDARSAGLEGYHWLSRDASRRGVFGYVMKPKFYKLDEAVRKAVATLRIPAWF